MRFVKSRLLSFVVIVFGALVGLGGAATADDLPSTGGISKPAPTPPPPPAPPPVNPADAAAATEAWYALEELGNAQASLFLTVRQLRVTGLPSVLVHRWRRVVELGLGGKLPSDDRVRVMRVRHAMAAFAKFVGVARSDVARAMAQFTKEPQFFGMFQIIGRGLDAALEYVGRLRDGREKFEAGAVRARVLANRNDFGDALDKFRKWAERFDLNAVRTAFYEALLFVTEEEPRSTR